MLVGVWAAAWSGPLPIDDEPPQVAAWLQAGWQAEQADEPSAAAQHYCQAARYGSLGAQYRLGMLLRQQPQDEHQAAAAALLAQAAQRGHALAAVELQIWGVVAPQGRADLACLSGGPPPVLVPPAPTLPAVAHALEAAVPHEEIEAWVAALPPEKRRHARLIQRLAPRFAVDARLALAIARAESNLESAAVSPRQAQGLMQLVAGTAERFGVRNPFDPEQNVRAGLSYLRWLLQRFDGDVVLASAAYNAGEAAVERYGGVPPYAETRAYVQRILHFYRARRHWPPAAM